MTNFKTITLGHFVADLYKFWRHHAAQAGQTPANGDGMKTILGFHRKTATGSKSLVAQSLVQSRK